MSEREREIFSQVAELAEQYQVEKVVLFGSRARRTHLEKSDIDLAVYGCRNFDDFYFDTQEKVWTLLHFDFLKGYIPEFQRLFMGLQDMYGDELRTL